MNHPKPPRHRFFFPGIYPLNGRPCVPKIYGSKINGYTYYTTGNLTALLSFIFALMSGVFGFINTVYTTNLAADSNHCYHPSRQEPTLSELVDRVEQLEHSLQQQQRRSAPSIHEEEILYLYQQLLRLMEEPQ